MKPIILIGLYGRDRLRFGVADALLDDYPRLAHDIGHERNVLHFDMETLPERGDALEHFDKGSVIIAHHLYYDEVGGFRPGTRYYYNDQNPKIVERADEAGVPLFTFGDYPLYARPPDVKRRGYRLWLPLERLTPALRNRRRRRR